MKDCYWKEQKVATATQWWWPLNRGLIPHSFLQLVQDFGYWPLNRWLLYGGLTIKLKEIWRS